MSILRSHFEHNASSAPRPRSGHFFTTCFTAFDVLPAKFESPPYTAVTDVVPTGRAESVKLASTSRSAVYLSFAFHADALVVKGPPHFGQRT